MQRIRVEWRLMCLFDRDLSRRRVIGDPRRALPHVRVELGRRYLCEWSPHTLDIGGGNSLGTQQQTRQGCPVGWQSVAAPLYCCHGTLGAAGGRLSQGQVALSQRVRNPSVYLASPPLDLVVVARHRFLPLLRYFGRLAG